MNDLIIIGCGGHTRTVIEIAVLNKYQNIELIDINFTGKKETILSFPVTGDFSILSTKKCTTTDVFVAIGDNKERGEYSDKIQEKGFKLTTLIHPTAIVSTTATVEEGVVIAAGAIINPLASLAKGVIVNTGSIIDHETTIGKFAHIAPGVKLAGRVSIGEFSFIGIGSSVIDKLQIGKNVVVGAGSILVKDVANDCKVVGVSKIIKA